MNPSFLSQGKSVYNIVYFQIIHYVLFEGHD